MRQAFTPMAFALLGGLLLGIVLIVLGVSKLPMFIASEVAFIGLFSVFYWKPTAIRIVFSKLMKKVR